MLVISSAFGCVCLWLCTPKTLLLFCFRSAFVQLFPQVKRYF